jgi:hypothetical protein
MLGPGTEGRPTCHTAVRKSTMPRLGMGGRDGAGLDVGAGAGRRLAQGCPVGARRGRCPSLRALPGAARVHGRGVSAHARALPSRRHRAVALPAHLVQLPHRLRLRPPVELLAQLAHRRRRRGTRYGARRFMGGLFDRPGKGGGENSANPHFGDSPDGSAQRPVGSAFCDVPLARPGRYLHPADGPRRHGHDALLRARVRTRLLPRSEGAL